MNEPNQKKDEDPRITEKVPNRTHHSNQPDHKESENSTQRAFYLGCLTKQWLIVMCVCVGLFILILVSAVTAVVITKKSASTATPLSFPTNGDMLDFLILSGQINNRDGLLATWFHRANSKDKMNEALSSNAMILESDVTLEGYGTPNVKPIPIMAHPPNIYSDNTLDQWLDAVLASPKAMKLDFKSLDSVGLSLDVLNQKNKSRNINRPVWINADILLGPNTPGFVPPLNGTRFLQFIQEKFPDVTVSPGWMVLYLPPLLTKTYTRQMMEDMYDLIRDVPQKVTFPIYTVLARSGWQHISWLLSLSSRFSLTLWQDSFHPNVSDLLFIRDNSHPTRVYYDIYEPTLSEFKEAAKEQGRVIRFYPGGDLMDFLHLVHNADSNSHPTNTHHSSLAVQWLTVTNKTSLFNFLSDATVGMLLIQVTSDRIQPRIPLVKASGVDSEVFTLQDYRKPIDDGIWIIVSVYMPQDCQTTSMASRKSAVLKNNEEETEEKQEEEEEEEVSDSPTEVKMSQIIMPCHCNHRQELCVGQLLKWIDITACLSAERHAMSPCVTASMDDINFEHTIRVGQVVSIKSKVNRAFNSSMEVGIQVSCEDLFSGHHWKVCHAYATFVTQRKETGERVLLKPIVPETQKEQLEYSLAAERRRVRMLHDDIIKDLLTHGCIQQGDSVEFSNAVAAEKTKVESVELVLPPHTNHQVNTFGGQIMAWMVNVATIAASRLCQTHPTLRTIDMFTFRGPSQIGDRLLLKAIVNNAFTDSIEVGVRAEAYQDLGTNRHINSAFMIFEVLDDHGKPCTLPRLQPEPLEGERRFQEAIARKKIRLDRKYIISRKQCEVPLSVPWNPRNQVYLSYNNVSTLKTLASRKKWRLSSEKDKVRLYSLEEKTMLSFRVDTEVDVPAHTAFSLLAELCNRPSWDTYYQ